MSLTSSIRKHLSFSTAPTVDLARVLFATVAIVVALVVLL